ncbi:MAG: hypothetical protein Q8R81_08395 [Novosphingobium sp.]|nr:hypothetical protein [Novosphingobium sp.]MDP3550402.1 hypothetical protein [Novosphingobium sp.]
MRVVAAEAAAGFAACATAGVADKAHSASAVMEGSQNLLRVLRAWEWIMA